MVQIAEANSSDGRTRQAHAIFAKMSVETPPPCARSKEYTCEPINAMCPMRAEPARLSVGMSPLHMLNLLCSILSQENRQIH